MTRARYETVIYVPKGNEADPTRPLAEFDAIADFLARCGAEAPAPPDTAPIAQASMV